MDLSQIALQLWPCWMLGILMVYFTWSSKYKKLLKIDPKGLLKFAGYMVFISIFRFIIFKFLSSDAMIEQARSMAHFIPWQATLGVFWEDACHAMPLVIASLMFRRSKTYAWLAKPLLLLVMFSFGAGHVYQGLLPAFAISFYVPVTMNLAKKYGFGTTMLCHIMYDMTTLLSIRWMLG